MWVVEVVEVVEWRATLGRTVSMPSPDAAARHTDAPAWRVGRPTTSGCATSAREAAAGGEELPPEETTRSRDGERRRSTCWTSVAEVGPHYTLLRRKETKAMHLAKNSCGGWLSGRVHK